MKVLRSERHREDQVLSALARELAEDAGAEGNLRLTAATGGFLLVLLAAQGLTLFSVGRFLTWHEFLGMVLVGPVALKLAATVYRFAGYYGGKPGYLRKGPPSPLLRMLAPLLVFSTVGIFATGIALLVVGHNVGPLVFLHQASFFVWLPLVAIHLLAYARKVPGLAGPDLRRRHPGALPGAQNRRRALLLSLVAGGLLAALTVGGTATYQREHEGRQGQPVGVLRG